MSDAPLTDEEIARLRHQFRHGFETDEDTDRLLDAASRTASAEAEVRRLREALKRINVLLSPGNRTFDELIHAAGLACDRARACLTPASPPPARQEE